MDTVVEFGDVHDVGANVEVSPHVSLDVERFTGVTQMNGNQLELNTLGVDWPLRIECCRMTLQFEPFSQILKNIEVTAS